VRRKRRDRRDLHIAQASGLRPAPAYIEEVYGGSWEEPPAGAGMRFAAPDTTDPPADSVTRLAQHLVQDGAASEAAAATLLSVDEALAEATSLEDLRDRLDRLAEAPPAEALAALYARADFVAGLAGIAGAPVTPESDTES